ncbi:MAG: DUF4236 domain-containing protein [Pseudomonadota bacterium]|nr:DUF4236 domain-containing protein [Pseudomonadota bacterium]
MGLRFHKSFALHKLLRVNVSKSGLSLGVGPKGANVNLSPRGMKGSVGLPGSGVSWRQQRRWGPGTSLWFFVLIAVVIVGFLYFAGKV